MATQVFKIPDTIKKDAKFTFCPGCDHGVAVRLVAECLDELGLRENTIAACSIGCSVTIYDFLNVQIYLNLYFLFFPFHSFFYLFFLHLFFYFYLVHFHLNYYLHY